MKKIFCSMMVMVFSVATAYAGEYVTFCWQLPKPDGSSCLLKLSANGAGAFYSVHGTEVCTNDPGVVTHVYGNGSYRGGKFEMGLTSTGMSADKSYLWHGGGVFEVDLQTLDGILYWMGDTEQKCGGNAPPCMVQERFSIIECPTE